jgi:hypothetical protein
MNRFFVVCAAMLALSACGGAGSGSKDVGGQCQTDRDCNSRCVTDSDFGGGMCTRSCRSDNDCPNSAGCIIKGGLICAVTCKSDTDCNSFGRGWVCKPEDRISGGTVTVCRLP